LASPLLEVRELSVSYGDVRALVDVSLEVEEGSIVALVGSNGAGKSTLLKAIAALLHPSKGQVLFMGEDLARQSTKHRVDRGIVLVPEGRRLFQTLSVLENLRLGAYLLKDRANGKAGLLSGGEQQMLAIGRAVMAHPKLVLIDEASLGLSPILTRTIFELIVALNQQGTTVLMVEQNIHMALNICQKAYVMKTGHIVLSGTGQELLANVDVRKAYVGERGSKL
jgi:branched-chain amino acid transport system ATP-binding protein